MLWAWRIALLDTLKQVWLDVTASVVAMKDWWWSHTCRKNLTFLKARKTPALFVHLHRTSSLGGTNRTEGKGVTHNHSFTTAETGTAQSDHDKRRSRTECAPSPATTAASHDHT